MHEHGLMKDLMRRILETAASADGRHVVGISVWLGALTHMSAAHFGEHFDDVSRGTIAEGAKVNCVTSDDIHDPRANDVVLTDVEVET